MNVSNKATGGDPSLSSRKKGKSLFGAGQSESMIARGKEESRDMVRKGVLSSG